MTQLGTAPYYRREHGEKSGGESHPPSPEPPQLGFLGNFLGLLRVTECHRARGRKSSVDIFVRVSARAKNGRQRRPVAKNGRQRRPVQHKNRRRARFGVRLARHPVKVLQRRWRAVACWRCTRAPVIIRFSWEEIVECHG